MKIRFGRGLDFTSESYISSTKPEMNAISRFFFHGATVSKIMLE